MFILWHRSHFQIRQFSKGQCCDFASVTWSRCEISPFRPNAKHLKHYETVWRDEASFAEITLLGEYKSFRSFVKQFQKCQTKVFSRFTQQKTHQYLAMDAVPESSFFSLWSWRQLSTKARPTQMSVFNSASLCCTTWKTDRQSHIVVMMMMMSCY